jgi:hypothetical protein
VTPLEEAARLLRKYGHSAQAVTMASLAARAEARVEGGGVWAAHAGPEVFGAEDSIAALWLGGPGAEMTPDLERDRAAFRRALAAVAQELRLRSFASVDSERWRARWKS